MNSAILIFPLGAGLVLLEGSILSDLCRAPLGDSLFWLLAGRLQGGAVG